MPLWDIGLQAPSFKRGAEFVKGGGNQRYLSAAVIIRRIIKTCPA